MPGTSGPCSPPAGLWYIWFQPGLYHLKETLILNFSFFEHLTFLCCLFLGHLHLSVFPFKCQDLINQKSGTKEANTQQSRSADLSGFIANGLYFFRLPAYILFQLSSRPCQPDLPGQPSCGRKTRLVSNRNKSY